VTFTGLRPHQHALSLQDCLHGLKLLGGDLPPPVPLATALRAPDHEAQTAVATVPTPCSEQGEKLEEHFLQPFDPSRKVTPRRGSAARRPALASDIPVDRRLGVTREPGDLADAGALGTQLPKTGDFLGFENVRQSAPERTAATAAEQLIQYLYSHMTVHE